MKFSRIYNVRSSEITPEYKLKEFYMRSSSKAEEGGKELRYDVVEILGNRIRVIRNAFGFSV